MVRQHRVTKKINPEPFRLQAEAIFNPGFAVIVVLPGQRIIAEQKAPPRRAIHHMHDGNFLGRKNNSPIWPSHYDIFLQSCETKLRENRMPTILPRLSRQS